MRYRLALLLVLIASTASAEERCLARETPRQCLRRLVAARAFVNAQADLDAATTGPNDASSPAHSAVKDFNSVLTAHVDAATPSDSGKALTVDYNFPGAFLGARQQLNLQVVLTDPSLSPAVKTELAADTTRLTALQQSLGRGDDVAATLTFNRVTPWFGRSLEPHRALLESILLGLVADSAPAGAITAEKLDTPFDQILPDAAARIPAMMDFETAAAAALPAAAQRLSKDFARLLSNQPQLYASAEVHRRSALIGPRERAFSLTWEIGTDNIDGFRRAEGRDCEAKGTCLAAFNDYASRTASARGNGRVALSVAYRRTLQNDPGISTPSTFEVIDAHKLRYAITYGRTINAITPGQEGRVDVTFTYEGKGKLPQAQPAGSSAAIRATALDVQPQLLPPSTTSFSAAATVTQPLWDRVSVPVSVIWAERTDWFPGTALPGPPISPTPVGGNGHTAPFSTTQRKVSVRFGVLYHIPSFSHEPAPSRGTPNGCCCK